MAEDKFTYIENSIANERQMEFDSYFVCDANNKPRITQSQLDDVSVWRIKEIYTIQQACLLMAGISPYKVKSISEAMKKGYTDYQIELATVVLDAVIDGLLLGTLAAYSIFCHSYNGTYRVNQSEFNDASDIDIDSTRIQAEVFFKWIKSRGIVSALQASKKSQLNEARALLSGASYTTPAIGLIIDHIEQNLDGAGVEYLENHEAQREWLRSTGKERGLSQNVCDAAYKVTQDPDSIKKFTRGHPAQGKCQKK